LPASATPSGTVAVVSRPVAALVMFGFVGPQFAYVCSSAKHDSICETALRASDLAEASWPFFCWPRNEGRAIAARMPMIRMTTRSSMSVKPCSSFAQLVEHWG
jgi:hypothetical protein